MRALEFIMGHVIYNPAYTYKFQLKTTHVDLPKQLINQFKPVQHSRKHVLRAYCPIKYTVLNDQTATIAQCRGELKIWALNHELDQ